MISEEVTYSPEAPPDASGTDQSPAPDGRGDESPAHTTSRTAAGTSRAVSLSQYWKACTKVMLRIPPDVTLASTTTPTITGPTHVGAPTADRSVSPAPWNCGIR